MVCRQGGDVIVTAFRPSEPACPQCGRPDVVPMMSGYPAPETQEPAHRGKAALGPCISPPPGERMNRACPLADIVAPSSTREAGLDTRKRFPRQVVWKGNLPPGTRCELRRHLRMSQGFPAGDVVALVLRERRGLGVVAARGRNRGRTSLRPRGVGRPRLERSVHSVRQKVRRELLRDWTGIGLAGTAFEWLAPRGVS